MNAGDFLLAAQPIMYVGSAYMHPDPSVRAQRCQMVTLATGGLIKKGVVAFSPIAHSHPIASQVDLDGGFETWRYFDLSMIASMELFGMLLMDGFMESKGMAEELRYARLLRKPVYVIGVTQIDRGEKGLGVHVEMAEVPFNIVTTEMAWHFGAGLFGDSIATDSSMFPQIEEAARD
ncbi:MAG: DUF1937 family protein [Porticoccaceae bacterium]|nr:DUF1937 family protein [Porticoccaceae bacterium]